MPPGQDPVDYDPFGADVRTDPFPAYAELHDRCPVHRFDGFPHPLYTVSRYDDVVAMLTDVGTWSSRYSQGPQYSVSGCLFSDPPEHTAYRKLVQKGFAPRLVARMEDDIVRLTNELLDEMAPRGRGDLHDDLACPLPVLVIAHILGVPTDQIEQFKAWSDESVEAMNSADPAASARVRAVIHEFFDDQLDQRRRMLARAGAEPTAAALGEVIPDDVMSGLLVADHDGRRLDQQELRVILNQLLVGGNETTTSLITNLFWRLLERPELYEQVRADPALDTVAVEESLRHDSPVLGLYRTATRDVELHRVPIAEKAKVMATFGAANRDPRAFDAPDEFRLDRDPAELRKHVAFGLGHHFCPGAHLSRLEARIALRTVVDRLPDLRLDGPTERIGTFLLWGRSSLPVAWDPIA